MGEAPSSPSLSSVHGAPLTGAFYGFEVVIGAYSVANVAPALALLGNRTVNEGESWGFPRLGFVTDPGFSNPALGLAEVLTYSINWGDGTPAETGAVAEVDGREGFSTVGFVNGRHTYGTDGVHTVTISVSDRTGLS